jgi:YggT family protein
VYSVLFLKISKQGLPIDNIMEVRYFKRVKIKDFIDFQFLVGKRFAHPRQFKRTLMYIIGNLLGATAKILDIALGIYMWIIIIRALLSWVNPDPNNPIVQFLYSITEPVMNKVRQLLPMSGIGIDFSPIIVILGIIFLQEFVVKSLGMFAIQLQ